MGVLTLYQLSFARIVLYQNPHILCYWFSAVVAPVAHAPVRVRS